MNISVHIERLILDGLPIAQRDRARLQAAIEEELSRLLTEGALAVDLRASGMLPRRTGGALELTSDEEPRLLGQRIARAVYGGIGE
jgi:hypothetical protein